MPFTITDRQSFLSNMFDNGSSVNFGVAQYVGLATGNPGDTGGAVQNDSTATSRIQLSSVSGSYSTDSSVTPWEMRYGPGVTYGSASGPETVTHWYTSNSTGASTYFYEQFPSAINVSTSDVVRWEQFRLRWRFTDVICSNANLMTWLANYFRGAAADFSIGSWYVGLSSTTPTILGGNFTEPVGNNYARSVVNSTDFTVGTSGTTAFCSNTLDSLSFPTASGDWTGLTHWGAFSASTGGTPHAFGALDSTVTVLSGETPSFLTNDWRVEMPAL